MKLNWFCAIIGVIGGFLTHLLGEYDMIFEALIVLMICDYITGLLVAGVFKKSHKTKSGGLNSNVGFKGLCRKIMMLMFVVVAHYIDIIMGIDYVRSAVIIGFCANECISLVENAGIMGLPLPNAIINAIELLNCIGKNRNLLLVKERKL